MFEPKLPDTDFKSESSGNGPIYQAAMRVEGLEKVPVKLRIESTSSW